ncbi:hypothetical protein BJX66DRAFT_319412 [Aspergillus keveii]|uniref:Uncharacterized protein n=1 Tax=Aspergillus keveii TaxID=714993 RepID=A0ABR4FI89_9EURO
MNICGTPSSHTTQNVESNKPIGERKNEQVLLGDGPQQLKQIISIPALSEGEPLLNDQQLPSISVVDSCLEDQLHSESVSSLSVESMKAPVHQRSPMPPSQAADVTPNLELSLTATKPPRRKSFEVAQARIIERKTGLVATANRDLILFSMTAILTALTRKRARVSQRDANVKLDLREK